jgi:hypothetical protein
MSNGNGENVGGLNSPVAEGGNVDEALRALLKAISESPGDVGNLQITLNVTGSPSPKDPGLDFTAGSYMRRVLPDPANPGTKKLVLHFIPDVPQAAIESDFRDHPDPGNKATWKKLLGDPQDVDIDEGTIVLRMDKTADSFTINWLSDVTGVQPIRVTLTRPDPDSPVPLTVDLAAFLECMGANSDLSPPARLTVCLSQL